MAQKKILLVDDSQTILMMEQMLLNTGPYEILTAKDGQEGVEKALAMQPDLILLDIVMPKMNGFEACKQLREKEETRKIPILMVTTRGEMQNLETGYQSGCSDYITKPINSVEFLSKVKNFLGE